MIKYLPRREPSKLWAKSWRKKYEERPRLLVVVVVVAVVIVVHIAVVVVLLFILLLLLLLLLFLPCCFAAVAAKVEWQWQQPRLAPPHPQQQLHTLPYPVLPSLSPLPFALPVKKEV